MLGLSSLGAFVSSFRLSGGGGHYLASRHLSSPSMFTISTDLRKFLAPPKCAANFPDTRFAATHTPSSKIPTKLISKQETRKSTPPRDGFVALSVTGPM